MVTTTNKHGQTAVTSLERLFRVPTSFTDVESIIFGLLQLRGSHLLPSEGPESQHHMIALPTAGV